MKRFAKNYDKQRLKYLFNICFPNENAFCNAFFNTVWKPENTIVSLENGEIISMLQMLPINLTNGKNKFSAYYIYAAATLPQYSNQGKMRELINYSFEVNADKDYAVLITQNDSLFGFYNKFDFTADFFVEKVCVNAKNNNIEISEIKDYEFFLKRRERFLVGTYHNEVTVENLQKNLFCSNSKIYCYKNSFCIFEKSENYSRISEAFGEDFEILAEQILFNEKFESCNALLPSGKTPFGMIKKLKSNLDISGYINILFN